MTRVLQHLPLLLALLAVPSTVFAHRLDEYLQATLVAIEPDDLRLQINLTPGVAIADQLLAQIDRDHDGVISAAEAAAYADSLKRDLIVRLDQRALELKLITCNVPAPTELRSGSGIIQMEFSLSPSELAAGTHRLTLENRHLPAMSVYLINAVQPRSGSIQITRQTRNDNQSTGEIEFTFHPPRDSFRAIGLVAALAFLLVGVVAGLWWTRKSKSCDD